jgi:hypothetical protein
MATTPVRHVQHDGHPSSTVVRGYENFAVGTPSHDAVLLPGRGSPTPAVSVAHYGVIEVSSPGSDALGTESSAADQAVDDGAGSSAVIGDGSRWYNGPWGALLCDMICFSDDFARKKEALFWDSINAEKQ